MISDEQVKMMNDIYSESINKSREKINELALIADSKKLLDEVVRLIEIERARTTLNYNNENKEAGR